MKRILILTSGLLLVFTCSTMAASIKKDHAPVISDLPKYELVKAVLFAPAINDAQVYEVLAYRVGFYTFPDAAVPRLAKVVLPVARGPTVTPSAFN